jgi:hypothetical protein
MAATSAQGAQPVRWKMERFEKKLPGCDAHPKTKCASVNLEYPAIGDAPAQGKTEISGAIQDMLLTPLEKGKAPANEDEFAAQILNHYQNWLQKGGNASLSWTVERKIDVQYSSPQVFCIRLLERVEQGQERSAKNTVYFNFRPEDGTLIQLSELIQPRRMDDFKAVAQRHFKDKDQKVPAGEDTKLPGEDFSLPKNFAIEKDGLRFRYEEDQVNPHSIRTPEFVVPYSDFRDLLRNGVKLP